MGDKPAFSKSLDIRSKLDHPVVDCDGHMRDFRPLLLDYLRETAGPQLLERYLKRTGTDALGLDARGGARYGSPADQDPRRPERRDWRTPRGIWFGAPMQNTLDAATMHLPRLLYERMDEIGLDYGIIYPNTGLAMMHERDAEIRVAAVRAVNRYFADVLRDYRDRLTAVAYLPMHTPQEALAELDYAVSTLGAKVVAIPPGVLRPIPALERTHPDVFPDASWFDNFCLDSAYDYDPLWKRCLELKVAVTCHGGVTPGVPWNGRSISSFVYNHLGNMAAQQHLFCKSLFLHGVTRRFPGLQFGFMECGVGWACMLYSDLLGHWDKRKLDALPQFDPARLDRARFFELVERYGDERMRKLAHDPEQLVPPTLPTPGDAVLDEWAALGIRNRKDFNGLFVDNFHFGCEADDPTAAWAFSTRNNPYGARLKAMLGSDIGHFDMPDMSEVLEEAWELVEHGLVDREDFRRFTFSNVASMHLRMNPRFFEGTRVADAAGKLLKDMQQEAAKPDMRERT
jgi:predicted TIM-barrel fold metal-dependent hydrolase